MCNNHNHEHHDNNSSEETVEEILARYSHLDQSDPFVGSQFPTPKGGVLTVVGWGSSRNTHNKKFSCHCSVCGEDKELFTDGFMVTKDKLIAGICPCGCSRNHRWAEGQNEIRVQRECIERGYIFHGWAGDYKGNKTYLDLENPETGNRWRSTNLNSFLSGRADSPRGKSKPEDGHLQDFIKAGFTTDYKFWRSDKLDTKRQKSYWYYTCPVCSNDEYVQAGVCSGVFESKNDHLKNSNKSCRCTHYIWTQEQREYQINKICKEEGLTFLGWENEEGYKNSSSKFKWLCTESHECCTRVNDFLNGAARCKTCSDIKQKESGSLYGYYPDRTQETDYLYILNFNNKYIKVGRSFYVDKRITRLRKLSKTRKITKIKILIATHQEVYDCEQWLHEELTQRGFYHEESTWSTETFSMDCFPALEKLLEGCDLEEVSSDEN